MLQANKKNLHTKKITEGLFSHIDLIKLIKQLSLNINTASPLNILSSKVNQANEINEKALEYSNTTWKNALSALCNPTFKLTVFIIYPGKITAIAYCVDQRNSDVIAACQFVGDDKINTSFPYEPSQILNNIINVIQVDNAVRSGSKELSLSSQGLLALFSALDSIKEILLVSLLSRQNIKDFKLPNSQLDLAIESSIKDKHNDNRWLVTLLRFMQPSDENPQSIIEKGFKELLYLKLIIDEGNNYWSPSTELMDMASSFLTPLPALYQEGVVIRDEEMIDSCSLTLRSINSLCLINFDKNTQEEKNISLRWLNKDEYWLEMMGRFIPAKIVMKPESKQDAENNIPITVSESLDESLNPIYKCPQCGASVSKGQKFCTHCGAKLPENLEPIQEKPIIKRCPVCGAELKPGAKFCTQCGAKI